MAGQLHISIDATRQGKLEGENRSAGTIATDSFSERS